MKREALFCAILAALQSSVAAQAVITEDAAIIILSCIIIVFLLISFTLLIGLFLVLSHSSCHRSKVCPLSGIEIRRKNENEFTEIPGRRDLQAKPSKTTPKLRIVSRDSFEGTETVSYDQEYLPQVDSSKNRPKRALSPIPEAVVINNPGATELGRLDSTNLPGTPEEDEVEISEI